MNLNLGLDAAALERRRKYICASDAARIMAGEWRLTWRIKMGLEDDPDLYDLLPHFVQRATSRERLALSAKLGQFTEPFNLAYCQQQTGRSITYFSDNPMCRAMWSGLTGERTSDEFVHSPVYTFMGCSLDGMTETAQGHSCPIDAKHVGRADDPMIQRYTAAGTHQATVMGCDWWALSVIVGNSRWELIEQEVDPLYQAELIATEREFWSFVERNEEPEDRTPGAPPPKPQPKLRVVQLEDEFRDAWAGLNWAPRFISLIEGFAGTEAAAKKHAIIRKEMAEVIPPDVGEITRGLFKAKRDKAGAIRLSLKKAEGEDDDAGR